MKIEIENYETRMSKLMLKKAFIAGIRTGSDITVKLMFGDKPTDNYIDETFNEFLNTL